MKEFRSPDEISIYKKVGSSLVSLASSLEKVSNPQRKPEVGALLKAVPIEGTNSFLRKNLKKIVL